MLDQRPAGGVRIDPIDPAQGEVEVAQGGVFAEGIEQRCLGAAAAAEVRSVWLRLARQKD